MIKRKYIYRFLFVSVLLLTYSLSASDTEQVDQRGYIVKVGDKAPDFEMILTNGDLVKTTDLRGKVVMLQFTASWCSVCRKEMPFIESDIWQKHKDNKSFALYGVDLDEPKDKVVEFAKTVGISYPMALDKDGEIFRLFAEKNAGVTRNVIIGKDGTIEYLTRLYNEEEFSSMKEKVDELLAK